MVTLRSVMLWFGAVFVGAGLGLLAAGQMLLGVIALAIGILLVTAGVIQTVRVRRLPVLREPERIEDLDEDRRQELIRGTSMHLRDMNYRYSVRYDRSERDPFTAEVNTVVLGFVPTIILDNRTDKQGYGFVAFPYDGTRWRGPGLPCAGDKGDALAHAARCVAPLDGDESA